MKFKEICDYAKKKRLGTRANQWRSPHIDHH